MTERSQHRKDHAQLGPDEAPHELRRAPRPSPEPAVIKPAYGHELSSSPPDESRSERKRRATGRA